MLRVLLTGASGFLGWNLLHTVPSNIQVVGQYGNNPIRVPLDETIQADIAVRASVDQMLEKAKPDAIIHTAAVADANLFQEEKERSFLINWIATNHMAAYAAEKQIPFIFTSTDLVFDGTQGEYKETDEPNVLSAYGLSKVSAELGIVARHKHACICRMPLMFGVKGPNGESRLNPMLEKMRNKEPLHLFTDEYRSTVDGRSAAIGIWQALTDNWQGIYHMGGRNKRSRYEFGIMMADAFGIKDHNIIAAKQADIPMAAARPADASLDSSKAYAKGYDPMPDTEALAELAKIMRAG